MKKTFLFLAALLTATVMNLHAATVSSVKYIDADGTEKTCASATLVENASSVVTWNAGWYVVTGSDVKLSKGATCNGAVHLILADGAKLTANGYYSSQTLFHVAGIQVTGSNNSLTIYGQTNQTGLLAAHGYANGAGIGGKKDGAGSNITINGGRVTAVGGNNAAGIGGGYGGQGSNITINGGKVIAQSDLSAPGIGNGKDCTTAASNIFVNPSLLLKADGNNPPTTVIAHATISTDVASSLAGKKYVTIDRPITGITLTGYNAAYDGKAHAIQVNGTKAGDVISYSTDNTNWSSTNPSYTAVGEKTVYVRVQRTYYLDWSNSAKVTITRKEISASGTVIENKTYDGNTSASVSSNGTLSNVIAGEEVLLNVASAEFEDKNVGEHKKVTVNYTISGKDVNKYTLKSQSATVYANITARAITMTSAGDSKQYDGEPLTNGSVTITTGSLAGSDAVSYDVTGSQTEVGSSPNTFTYNFTTGSASNYAITQVEGTLEVTAIPVLGENLTTADLTALKGQTLNVKIGRTMKENGIRHTICLPFDLSESEFAASPYAGCSLLQEFSSATIVNKGEDNETLVLEMTEVSPKAIEAGKPYIIAWDKNDDAQIECPQFDQVTIKTDVAEKVTSGEVSFCGTFVPYQVEANDKDILFINPNGKLNWPNVGGKIKGFRCYFSLKLAPGSPLRRGMAAMLGDGKNHPTSVEDAACTLYDVQKLIEEGRVVIISNGVRYDMNGNLVK